MAAKMKLARSHDGRTYIGLEVAQSGTAYLCEHCSAEVRYNAGYEMVRKGVSILVEHYFKLKQKHVHDDECSHNIKALIETAVSNADPGAVQQLRKGVYELRLMFPESYKTAPPSKPQLPSLAPSKESQSQGRKFVSNGKLNSYLNTAERILKVRAYCEENQDIEEHLVLSFGGRKVRWSDFYIEQDEYSSVYARIGAKKAEHPLALAGTIQDIVELQSKNDPNRPYWIIQLSTPKTRPDEHGMVTKVDAYLTTGKADLVKDLLAGDAVVVFGGWSAGVEKISINKNPRPNSTVKSWKNLPLTFSLTHSKQIVRTNKR